MDNNYTKKSPNNRAPFVYELYFLTYVNIFTYLTGSQEYHIIFLIMLADVKQQLVQLLLINSRRSVQHYVTARVVLRECDAVTD